MQVAILWYQTHLQPPPKEPTPRKECLNWYTQLHSEFNSPISSFLKDTLSISILESLD